MPAFFPILETLLKRAFWYRQQLLFRFFFYLLNRSKMLSFHQGLQFWEEKKSPGTKSGEYGGWGMITVSSLVKISHTSIDVCAGAGCNDQLCMYLYKSTPKKTPVMATGKLSDSSQNRSSSRRDFLSLLFYFLLTIVGYPNYLIRWWFYSTLAAGHNVELH